MPKNPAIEALMSMAPMGGMDKNAPEENGESVEQEISQMFEMLNQKHPEKSEEFGRIRGELEQLVQSNEGPEAGKAGV